jgi:hypothetical protein
VYEALTSFVNLSEASAAFSLYVPTVGPCVPQGSGFTSGWVTRYFTVAASSLPAVISWDAVNGDVVLASPPALNVSRLALAPTDCFVDPTDPNAEGQVVVFSPPPSPPPPPPPPPPVALAQSGSLACLSLQPSSPAVTLYPTTSSADQIYFSNGLLPRSIRYVRIAGLGGYCHAHSGTMSFWMNVDTASGSTGRIWTKTTSGQYYIADNCWYDLGAYFMVTNVYISSSPFQQQSCHGVSGFVEIS